MNTELKIDNNYQIYGNKNIILEKKQICLSIGNFDGVHLGHQSLLNFMQKYSSRYHLPIVIVTFEPNSANFFSPQTPKQLLTNLSDKIELLLNNNVSSVIVQPFQKEFSSLTKEDFCELWLSKNFNIHSIILGYDFCYGRNREGNFFDMQHYGNRYGWEVIQIPPYVTHEIIPISSTSIRNYISQGEMLIAQRLLGRTYLISGIVIHGDHRGREIGFPTANLQLECNYVLPKHGVYACYVEIEDKILLPAVLNCGIRPSIAKNLEVQIEAHILNFNEDIYGKYIKFYIKKFLRSEKKFANLSRLIEQIEKDIIEAKKCFIT